MKKIITMMIICLMQLPFQNIIKSTINNKIDGFELSLEGYKKSETWGDWSVPIGKATASSTKNINYNIDRINDLNLNTAWVPKGNGINESFSFKFDFPPNTAYADPYQFQGICRLFNGYCKTTKLWRENARIKELKLYYNDNFLCQVELIDSWQLQVFDISQFFKNKRDKKFLNAKYEIKTGDMLTFVISETYKGTKYNDVAISEFLCEGAGN